MSTKHASKKYTIAIVLAFIAWSPALVVPAAHAQSVATLTLNAAAVSMGSGDDGVVPAAQEVPDRQAAPAQARAVLQLSKLPLDFIENRGQWETPTKFAVQKGVMAAAFEPDAIKLLIGKDRPISLGLIFERASQRR